MAAFALLAGASSAFSHVTLAPGGAAAGSDYEAAFRVGHACKDANATTGLRIELPQGFALQDAQARPGWTLATRPAVAKNDSTDGASVSDGPPKEIAPSAGAGAPTQVAPDAPRVLPAEGRP